MKSIDFMFDTEDKEQIKKLFPVFKTKYNDFKANGERCVPVCDANELRPRVWNFFRAVFGVGGSEEGILTGNSHYEHANKIALFNVKRNWFYTQDTISDEQIDELCSAIEKHQNTDNSEERQYILDRGHWAEAFIKHQFLKYFDEYYKEYLEAQFGNKIAKFEVYEDNNMYLLCDLPMFADFDGRIKVTFEDGSENYGIMEYKTVKGFMADEKFGKSKCGEFIPPNYFDQVQHYLNISNCDFAVLAFDGESFGKSGIRFIKADYVHIGELQDLACSFWHNNVMTATVPTEANKDFLAELKDKKLAEGDATYGRLFAKKLSSIVELETSKSVHEKEARALEKQINIIKSETLQEMTHNTALAKLGNKVYRCNVIDKNSSRFDKNKFLKAFPDQKENVDKFTTVTPSRTLKITLVEGGI